MRVGSWLCGRCGLEVLHGQFTCIICEQVRARGSTCAACRDQTSLTGAVSIGPYGSPLLRRGVHWLKFRGVRACAQPLAALLSARAAAIAPLTVLRKNGVLVPIPLHKRRARERGFNQSEELARYLSQMTGIPLWRALQRRRATWTQSKLPALLRADNVARAFTVTAPLPDIRWWLLIDDVTTSGATLSAAGEALLSAVPDGQPGTRQPEIWGVTVARG
ncbi:MAG: ComF family protein [Candidatus Andersenbacteria bacterium]|nr:ComF family protein [Candidatus Andersenbacteria bacterium]